MGILDRFKKQSPVEKVRSQVAKAVKEKQKKAPKKSAPVMVVDAKAVENLVLSGDINKLSPMERISYHNKLCQSLGMNPMTKPFQVINMKGKEVLYATKAATDQLRKINGITITKMEPTITPDEAMFIAYGMDHTGRQDSATGVVTLTGKKGDDRANAIMKAETKAKRRLTLSLSGLGILDESEVSSIQGAKTYGLEDNFQTEEPEEFKSDFKPTPKPVQKPQPRQTQATVVEPKKNPPKKPEAPAATQDDTKKNDSVFALLKQVINPEKKYLDSFKKGAASVDNITYETKVREWIKGHISTLKTTGVIDDAAWNGLLSQLGKGDAQFWKMNVTEILHALDTLDLVEKPI